MGLLSAFVQGSYANYERSSYRTFIEVSNGFAFLIFFLVLYYAIFISEQQQRLAELNLTNSIYSSQYNAVLDEANAASKIIPNFAQGSVLPATRIATDAPDPDTPEANMQKYVLTMKMVQLWQTVLLNTDFSSINQEAFITRSIQRTWSKDIYEVWTLYKDGFNPITQKYVDLLFEYGMAVPVDQRTPEGFQEAAKLLQQDPRWEEIITAVSQEQ